MGFLGTLLAGVYANFRAQVERERRPPRRSVPKSP